MKKDGEVKLLLKERRKGTSQKLAAARTGMSERTARKYEQSGKLPSQMKVPRTHRTRENAFAADWPWVEDQLRRDQALQTKTLFALLCQAYPGRYERGGCARVFLGELRCVIGRAGSVLMANRGGALMHRTDNLSAAVRDLDRDGRFLLDLVRSRNLTRSQRFEADRAALRPLPNEPLNFARELSMRVSRFSLIRVLNNYYSVPSRLIGAKVKVRVRSESLELYHGAAHVLSLPRVAGRDQHRIDWQKPFRLCAGACVG
jgi:transcriptional regulator with XRE-family HTH domain